MNLILRTSDSVVIYAGDQFKLTETGVTGDNYLDPSLTPANASQVVATGAFPATYISGCYTYVNGVWTVVTGKEAMVAAALAPLKAAFIKKVDTDVDAIYDAAVGNRGPEYDQASLDANAFKAASYGGTIPSSVSSWATAKGWSAQVAADDIIAAAARLAAARDAIRAQRLLRKEQAKATTDSTALETVSAQWVGFVAAVRSQLGV